VARKPLIAPGSILPSPNDPPPPPDDLLSRVIAKDRARRHPAPETEGTDRLTNRPTDQPTDQLTGQPESQTSRGMESFTENNIESNILENTKNNTISNTTDMPLVPDPRAVIHEDAEPRPLSMAEQIRQNARAARVARAAPLKMVTLKVAPELDDQIEAHCQQTGRKKQEVIRDALRLYLEVVGQPGDEEEEEA
jgi:hypothetical protein